MKIRKNLITILLVLSTIMLVCSTNVSNAADNAKIGLTADKTEAVAGDTVKITVKVKDITGITDGIIGLQGNLVYDNTIFESVTFANLNNWDKPDYNETNGSFLTSKGDFVKNDEDVFTISLKFLSEKYFHKKIFKKVLTNVCVSDIIYYVVCRCGGIGRRARLRI